MGKKLTLLVVFMAVLGLLGFYAHSVSAQNTAEELYDNSGLPLPRFVTLKSDKVFVRTGPGVRYPIKWVFQKKHLPVEVIQEFDTWRQIRDFDKEEGWIHQSLLSGKRYALVKEAVIDGEQSASFRRKPVNTSDILVFLEENVLIELLGCSGAWCAGKVQGYKGYIERKYLWGIYEDEELD